MAAVVATDAVETGCCCFRSGEWSLLFRVDEITAAATVTAATVAVAVVAAATAASF